MPVTVGLANIASVLGVVCIACRRGGRVLMYVTAAAIAVMARSIPAEMLAAVWNPAAALLPFTALVFLCWSVACGDLRLLPLTVVAASFVMQCHLTYVVPTLGLLTVAGFGLVLGGTALDHRTTRNWLIGSAILGVVCWGAPLLQQAIDRPGNLVVLKRAGAASHATLSTDVAVHAVERAIGLVPWWMRSPRSVLVRIGELNTAPGTLAALSTAMLLALVIATMLVGARGRRRDVVTGAAVTLTLCAALVLSVTSVPRSAFGTVGYGLWWASVVGLWTWLFVGWSVVSLGWGVRLARPLQPVRRRLAVASVGGRAAALGVVSIVGVWVAAHGRRQDPERVPAVTAEHRRTTGERPGQRRSSPGRGAASRRHLPHRGVPVRRHLEPSPTRSRGDDHAGLSVLRAPVPPHT